MSRKKPVMAELRVCLSPQHMYLMPLANKSLMINDIFVVGGKMNIWQRLRAKLR